MEHAVFVGERDTTTGTRVSAGRGLRSKLTSSAGGVDVCPVTADIFTTAKRCSPAGSEHRVLMPFDRLNSRRYRRAVSGPYR